MDPLSENHKIQPTGHPLFTALQQSYNRYNSITHTQLVEEQSNL